MSAERTSAHVPSGKTSAHATHPGIHLGDIASAASGARRVPQFAFPISRHTDVVSIRPGVRVIVRYLIDKGEYAGKATDIIGFLRSVDPLVVEVAAPSQDNSSAHTPLQRSTVEDTASRHAVQRSTRHNVQAHTIDPSTVIVLKALPAAPVRNSDIRAVEAAAAAAFPGTDNRMIGSWLARAGDGITERSNSAVPIGPNAGVQPVPLAEIREFYAAHAMPTMLMVPDRIGRTAENIPGVYGPEIVVMTRPLNNVENVSAERTLLKRADIHLTIEDQPSAEWLSMYHFRGKPLPEKALRLLTEKIDGQMCFASLYVNGALAAITRGTITEGGSRQWLGFSAVEVNKDFRRQGLASSMGAAMLEWGAEHGASSAYLDVISTNVAGRALYHRLGFSEHHRHRSLSVTEGQ